MFLSKKLAIPVIAISLLGIYPSLKAAQPKTFVGKLSASTVQTVHSHPTITSFLLTNAAIIGICAKTRCIPDGIGPVIFWGTILGSYLLDTGTQALMQNFEIDPIKK